LQGSEIAAIYAALMVRSVALAVAIALVVPAGCGSGQHERTRRGPPWYEVRFTAAALPAQRATGAPWHASPPDRSIAVLFGLLGLAVGYPVEGFALGSALVAEPTPEAPAPFVVVKIAGETYRISPIGQTLAPTWSQPMAIPAHYAADTPALIQVLDAIDQSVIAQRELRAGDLLAPGARTLTGIGDVASLDVAVRRMPPREAFEVEMHVDPRRTLQELADGRDPSWAAIPVWNGDRIHIEAAGEVCPSKPTPCFGPQGAEPGRWRSYNYDGYEDARHASLVGLLPGQPIAIGARADVVAEQAGLLLLFVNDTDVGNDDGGFDVLVHVDPGP